MDVFFLPVHYRFTFPAERKSHLEVLYEIRNSNLVASRRFAPAHGICPIGEQPEAHRERALPVPGGGTVDTGR